MRIRSIITLAVALLTATASFAQKQTPPAPGTPRSFSLPEIRRIDLPNGLKVRLVPYGDVPKVTIRLVTQTGNADEGPNETWLADLTGELMQQGTTTRTPEVIAQQIAMMGGAIDVSVGMNQTVIGTDVFSESAADAIALVADMARNPLLPASELARLKGDLARNLSVQKSTPQALAQEKFYAVMFPGHAYGRLFPTEAMLQGYTLEQVRAFYENHFGAARSYVYVVGRFDAPAVEAAIRTALGDWTSGTAAPKQSVTSQPRRAVYLIDRPGAVQSTLYVGLPVIDPSNPDYLAFGVMNALLGGSFGSRITSNIREQKGYTYSPTSLVTTRLGAASWSEIADVTTNVTGASIKEILGEIDRLRATPPSESELRGIQNYLAGTFVLRNSARPGIASQLSFLDLHGLPEDYLRNYVQRVYAVTPADIQRLTQSYIDPARIAIVVAGDRKAVLDQIKTFGDVIE